MTDDRPRPEYGEYATPEQQAAAMGKPWPPPPEPQDYIEQQPDAAQGRPGYPQAWAARQPGYANRFFTVFLLGFGALNLFGDIPVYLNFASAFKGYLSSSGFSGTVPTDIGAAGIPIFIANIIVYGLTVFLSVFAMRRGRSSFYIPVLGFIVFIISASIIVSIVSPSLLSGLSK